MDKNVARDRVNSNSKVSVSTIQEVLSTHDRFGIHRKSNACEKNKPLKTWSLTQGWIRTMCYRISGSLWWTRYARIRAGQLVHHIRMECSSPASQYAMNLKLAASPTSRAVKWLLVLLVHVTTRLRVVKPAKARPTTSRTYSVL